MIIQPHRVHVGENTREELSVTMVRGAQILHVHHYGLPHGYVEIVEMHPGGHETDTEQRTFIVIDSFCCKKIDVPQSTLRFINALPFDNHVWSFFEVLG